MLFQSLEVFLAGKYLHKNALERLLLAVNELAFEFKSQDLAYPLIRRGIASSGWYH